MAVNLIFERQLNKHKLNVHLIVLIVCEKSLTYLYIHLHIHMCVSVCLAKRQPHSLEIFIGCEKAGILAYKYRSLSIKNFKQNKCAKKAKNSKPTVM